MYSMRSGIEILCVGADGVCPLPVVCGSVAAGFPSPADDYIDGSMDLNEHLIAHPAATFFVRASGNSMINAGIHDGDLLIVDRAIQPADGSITIVAIDGELTVKRIAKRGGNLYLAAENSDYPDILVSTEADLHVWGVCRHVIHRL